MTTPAIITPQPTDAEIGRQLRLSLVATEDSLVEAKAELDAQLAQIYQTQEVADKVHDLHRKIYRLGEVAIALGSVLEIARRARQLADAATAAGEQAEASQEAQ